MNLEERTKKDLTKLCRSTYDGMFLEATNDETSIDIAFQSLTDIIFKNDHQQYIVETFN
jgi:hypothetical protein